MLKIESDDETSLVEFWRIARKNIKTLLLTMVFSAIGGFSFSLFAPDKWDGIALIQIGQVGQDYQIEHLQDVATKISHASFLSSIIEDLFTAEADKDRTFLLLKESIRVNVMNHNNMLEIKLRSYSPEMTKSILVKMTDKLLADHNTKLITLKERINVLSQLSYVALNILNSKKNDLRNYVTSDCVQNMCLHKFFDNLYNKEKYNLAKKNRSLELENIKLSTFPTAIVGKIHVDSKPTTVGTIRWMVISSLMGLFFSFCFITVYNIYLNKR